MPTNSEYSKKSQNQNNFSVGKKKMTWLEWIVCRGIEDKNEDWAQTSKSFECQASVH